MATDTIKSNLHFYLRDKKAQKPTPIILFIRYNGNLLKYATGKAVNPHFWDEKKERLIVSSKYPTHSSINDSLNFINSTASKLLNKALAEKPNEIPAIESIREVLDAEIKPKNAEPAKEAETLLTFCNGFLEQCKTKINKNTGRPLTKNSITVYNQVLNVLKEYKNLKFGKRIFSFAHIDRDFYKKYQSYLISEKLYATNTAGKHLKTLKTYFLEAKACGLMPHFDAKGFESISEKVESIYLSESEILQLYNLDLSANNRLEKVRDTFVIGCWTGLRFSDFTRLKAEHINGEFIEIETQKTGENVVIGIHPMVAKIFAKYNKKLPKAISNQRMNNYLKEIAVLAGFDESITKTTTKGGITLTKSFKKSEMVCTHTARRSFATNAYLKGFDIVDIMAITGHRTESAFMKYIKITKRQSAQKMLNRWNAESIEAKGIFKIAN